MNDLLSFWGKLRGRKIETRKRGMARKASDSNGFFGFSSVDLVR